MATLQYTLLGDGSSDRALLPHVFWLLRQHVRNELELQPQWADLSRLVRKPQGLAERIRAATEFYPCDLFFVHRDAERASLDERVTEITAALASLPPRNCPVVCVVPVRMTEAWLLFDAAAVRSAAGNPRGAAGLELPSLKNLEDLPDPKAVLHEKLRLASDLTGRRLKKLAVHCLAIRVADYIEDFSPLRRLSAFQRFERDLLDKIRDRNWT